MLAAGRNAAALKAPRKQERDEVRKHLAVRNAFALEESEGPESARREHGILEFSNL
jgi:hypothetical protein